MTSMKWLGVAVAYFLLIAAVGLAVQSCTVRSPISGQKVDAETLQREYQAFEAQKKAEAESVRRQTELKIQQAQEDAEFALASLKHKADVEAGEINRTLQASLRAIGASHEASLASIEVDTARVREATEAAAKEIERQNALLSQVWGAAQAVIGATPAAPLLPILTVGSGLLGIGYGVKKRRDQGQMEEAFKSLVNALDAGRANDPALKERMAANKGVFLEQLSDLAVKLIDQERLVK